MIAELTPLLKASIGFAYAGGIAFVVIGGYLTYRHRRLHPLLLVCISALSFSWIEAPYDWAVYAQFAPAIPRMPSWWPLNMTWGGLPASVPPGYIAYFVLPAVIGAALGRRLSSRFHWRRPTTLLAVGLVVGILWAFLFNAILGARLGVFYYGRVIPGLALWQRDQAPVPALRRSRHGGADDGVHLHPRTHGSTRSHRYRHVGRCEVDEPFSIVGPLHRRGRCHRNHALWGGLGPPSRCEVARSGDGRAHGSLVQRRTEPTPAGRLSSASLNDRPSGLRTSTARGWS